METKGMIQLDPKLIDSLVKEHINAAMLSVLADKKEVLLSQMANQVLNLKVNSEGQISNYPSENKYSWIEITINKELRGAVQRAIIDAVKAMEPEILASVKKEVSRSGPAIAKAMMDGFHRSVTYDWSFKVNIGTTGKE